MKYENQKQKIYSSMIENARHFQLKFENKLPSYQYKIPVHRLQEYLDLYHWRIQNKSSVVAFQWLKIQPHNEKQVTIVLKSINNLCTLQEIKAIKGCKIMKNISKIFDSFDLLFRKFGPFELTAKMMAFDEFYEPFVWMHGDHIKNEYKRDFVSEAEFGQNILKILLKYSDKFQIKQFVEHCYLVKGGQRTLKEMSHHFYDFKQVQINQNNERDSKSNDENQGGSQCILTFSKISKRKKKKTNSFSNAKSQNQIYTKVVKSYLRASENRENSLSSDIQHNVIQDKTNSTTSSIPQSHSIAQPSYLSIPSHRQNNANGGALNIRKQLCTSFCFEDADPVNQNRFNNHKNELAISIMGPETDQLISKEIIELPHLDKYQKCLTKSIIEHDK